MKLCVKLMSRTPIKVKKMLEEESLDFRMFKVLLPLSQITGTLNKNHI